MRAAYRRPTWVVFVTLTPASFSCVLFVVAADTDQRVLKRREILNIHRALDRSDARATRDFVAAGFFVAAQNS